MILLERGIRQFVTEIPPNKWSQTKVNRCLAEGRERYRAIIARSESGGRCAELRPILSAFCDGEASPEETATLREHLRACAHCRAALRTYRAAPGAASALLPLPVAPTLLERAHDALVNVQSRVAERLPGGGADAATQLASTGGASGLGVAGAAKLAALCVGAAGGAAACVGAGVVPSPLDSAPRTVAPAAISRPADATEPVTIETEASPEPAPAPTSPNPAERNPEPDPEPALSGGVEYAPEAEAAPTAPAPVESAPPPTPPPAPVDTSGSAAGEFGP